MPGIVEAAIGLATLLAGAAFYIYRQKTDPKEREASRKEDAKESWDDTSEDVRRRQRERSQD